MPSAPPGDSDEERGSEEGGRPVADGGAPGGAEESPDAPFGGDVFALFASEAGVEGPGDTRRAARLLHEVAHQHQRAGRTRDAAKLFTRSLTLDPSLQANAWALRRIFSAHGFWENLVRLLDAQIRFAPLPLPADRADLLVEKGRLLEDRLARPDEALSAYRAAVELDSRHGAALVAWLLLALRQGGPGDLEAALGGLFSGVAEPDARAQIAVELARRQRGPLGRGLGREDARRSADTLFRALSSGAAPRPLLAELDRISLVTGMGDLRARVLDAFDSRLSRDTAHAPEAVAAAAAIYREKARTLVRRGAREAALAVLERALAVAPEHPLVLQDFIDLADEVGRADALGGLLARPEGVADEVEQEALLRRAEVAARSGALGEAVEALDRLRPGSELAPLAALARACLLVRLGDLDGLARLWQNEAEKLLANAAAPAGREREAAHLLVRAATLRLALDDAEAGEALCRRAISIADESSTEARDAEAGLLEGLARRGRWDELATRLEAQLEASAGPERERRRRCLVFLRGDVMGEPARALELLRAARDDAGEARFDDELGFALRALAAHLAARGNRRGAEGGVAADEATPAAEAGAALERVAATAADARLSAALRTLAARLFGRAGLGSAEREALLAAFADDATGAAASELERAALNEGRAAERIEGLAHELGAARAAGLPLARERALRFRLALAAAEQGRVEEAAATLEPLRRVGDELAIVWSLDLVRAARDRTLEIALLQEALADELAATSGEQGGDLRADEPLFERLFAFAEALEAQSGGAAAVETIYRRALRRAPPGRAPLAALALVRLAARRADAAALVEATQRLAEALEEPERAAMADEAARLALAAGLESDDVRGGSVTEALRRLWSALGDEAPVPIAQGLERLAQATGPGAPGALWGLAGVVRALGGEGEGAWAPLVEAAAAGGFVGLEVAATDLSTGRLPPPLAEVRRAHGERLFAEEGPGSGLGEALLIEDAAEAEGAGRLRAAATTYARVLADRPQSLEAADGLLRVAEATGDPLLRSQALAEVGALLRSPRQAAARFAEAALLLEEIGRQEGAARLYVRVLERVPTDDEAYHRLHQILERRGDHQRLDSLISLRLQHTVEVRPRLALLLERARLRAEQLGRRDDAILDYRRALAIDPAHQPSLRALARAAREARRFELAVAHLQAADQAVPADRAVVRLELAEVLEESGRPAAALDLLREMVDAQPAERAPRERLIALALRLGHTERALEQLRAIVAIATAPAEKASALHRIGELERDHRHAPAEAVTAFRAALELDPLGEAAAELAALVPARAALLPADEFAVDRVLALIRRDLAADPLDRTRLARVRDLARLRGAKTLADGAGQLLAALGEGVERGRARDLLRLVSPTRLASLGVAADEPSHLVGEVAPIVAEAIARVEELDPSDLGIGRQSRVAPGSDPRLKWVEATGLSLGVSEFTIHVGGADELQVVALDAPEPILLLGRGTVGGDPASRFRVGRALELLRRRATGFDRRSLAELEALWRAVAWLAGLRGGADEPATKAKAKALGRFLARREIKALEAYRARFEHEPLDVALWRRQAMRAADRVGLLAAGDLAQALRSRGGGATMPAEDELRRPPFSDLIAFALDDLYATLRVEAGLGDL